MPSQLVNPVLKGDYPDPSIVRDGQDYYLTYSCGALAPGLKIMHSCDLVNWTTINIALRGVSRNVMAPELIRHNGLYYLYYPEGGSNYVVTAARPDGEWSDPVDLCVQRLIDPGHIATPEGERFLFFSGGYAAQLSDDGLSLLHAPQKVYDGWPFGDRYHTEGFFLESPKLLYRNGYYYLISAQGGTAGPATAHMAVAARAKHPMGPWENMPANPLVHTDSRLDAWWCKGHGTVFEDHRGAWWILYHAYAKGYLNLGRQVLLQRVIWTDDGWPCVPDDATAPIRLDYDLCSSRDTLDDDFPGPSLKPTWCFRTDPDPARYTFGHGGIVLRSRGNTPGESLPMTVTCGDHAYRIDAQVTRQEGACAGLILQYDDTHYVGLGLEDHAIRLFKYGRPYASVPYDSDTAHLRIVNDHHQVHYEYSRDGERWTTIPFGCEVSGLNHNALDGYDSLRPGLFAFGSGAGLFRNFRYTPI